MRAVPSHSVFIYRLNSTAAPEEGSNQNGDKPKKRAVPRADSFGDIFIRMYNSSVFLFHNHEYALFFVASGPVRGGPRQRTGFRPNLEALGHNEYSNPLASRLARRQTGASPQQQGEDTPKPSVQGSERPFTPRTNRPPREIVGERRDNRRDSNGYDNRRDSNGADNRRDSNRYADTSRTTPRQPRDQPRNETGRRESGREPRRREDRKEKEDSDQPRAQISAKNIHIETTDLESLFGPPKPATETPVVASSAPVLGTLTSSSTETVVTHHAQLLLERVAGDYRRYLYGAPQVIRGDTLSTVGPVGYAQMTVMRRQDAGLNQRKNALRIVSTMTKDIKPSAPRV